MLQKGGTITDLHGVAASTLYMQNWLIVIPGVSTFLPKNSTGIVKYGSHVLKTIVNVARSNPFSVYNMIMNNWCNSISGELRSNVSVLHDMIDIRHTVKEWDILCIDDVLFIIDDICIN